MTMKKTSKVCIAFSQSVGVRTRNPCGKAIVRASPPRLVTFSWSKCRPNSSKQFQESSNRPTMESSSVAHSVLTHQVCPVLSRKTPMGATHSKVTKCPSLSTSKRCSTMSTLLLRSKSASWTPIGTIRMRRNIWL